MGLFDLLFGSQICGAIPKSLSIIAPFIKNNNKSKNDTKDSTDTTMSTNEEQVHDNIVIKESEIKNDSTK